MKRNLILVLLFFAVWITPFLSQQNLLPNSSYYKDKLFSPFNNKSFSNGSFLPACESEINLIDKIADSTKQYYYITSFLIKRHLFELSGKDYYLTISPTFDIARGKDLNDSLGTKYYQNTRGYHIEGDLLKKFSFSTSFYENQSTFNKFETDYYKSAGELYPTYNSYSLQNAVIPGAARTKPFKQTGFDYAYAIGNVIYSPTKNIKLIGGNNSHFIGTGHRSLFLSDNSIYTPYFQMNLKLNSKWNFVYMRTRLMNLIRRPIQTDVEAYYQPKGYSVNYLTYNASDKITVSFFEGIIWSKGDSISSHKVNPMFYNPIPGISELGEKNKKKINGLLGVNLEYIYNSQHRFYNQIALSNYDLKNIGFQIGYRGYDIAGLKNFMVQAEYNNLPKHLYYSKNSNLNYSNYNLPLAHTKGTNFQEFLVRANYEYQYIYVDVKLIVYSFSDYIRGSLEAVNLNTKTQTGIVQNHQFEVGCRFNRKMNITVFGSYLFRNDTSNNLTPTKFFNFGIRTGLINHYNDF